MGQRWPRPCPRRPQVRSRTTTRAPSISSQGLMQTALATLRGRRGAGHWTQCALAEVVTRSRHLAGGRWRGRADRRGDHRDAGGQARALCASSTPARRPRRSSPATPATSSLPADPGARQSRALIAALVHAALSGGPGRHHPRAACEPAAFETVGGMLKAMGKQPLGLKSSSPAMSPTGSRRRSALEVQQPVDEGVATAPEIDAAIIHGLALRLPILGFSPRRISPACR